MDELEELYEKLNLTFDDLPDKNTFINGLRNEKKRVELHDVLSTHFGDVPNYDRFSSYLDRGFKAKGFTKVPRELIELDNQFGELSKYSGNDYQVMNRSEQIQSELAKAPPIEKRISDLPGNLSQTSKTYEEILLNNDIEVDLNEVDENGATVKDHFDRAVEAGRTKEFIESLQPKKLEAEDIDLDFHKTREQVIAEAKSVLNDKTAASVDHVQQSNIQDDLSTYQTADIIDEFNTKDINLENIPQDQVVDLNEEVKKKTVAKTDDIKAVESLEDTGDDYIVELAKKNIKDRGEEITLENVENEEGKLKTDIAHKAFKKDSFIYNGLNKSFGGELTSEELDGFADRIVNRTIGQHGKDFLRAGASGLSFGIYDQAKNAVVDEIENLVEFKNSQRSENFIYLSKEAIDKIADTMVKTYEKNTNEIVNLAGELGGSIIPIGITIKGFQGALKASKFLNKNSRVIKFIDESQSSLGKQFTRNSLEALPYDLADAYIRSVKDGKTDTDQFLLNIGLNIGLGGAIGTGIERILNKLSKSSKKKIADVVKNSDKESDISKVVSDELGSLKEIKKQQKKAFDDSQVSQEVVKTKKENSELDNLDSFIKTTNLDDDLQRANDTSSQAGQEKRYSKQSSDRSNNEIVDASKKVIEDYKSKLKEYPQSDQEIIEDFFVNKLNNKKALTSILDHVEGEDLNKTIRSLNVVDESLDHFVKESDNISKTLKDNYDLDGIAKAVKTGELDIDNFKKQSTPSLVTDQASFETQFRDSFSRLKKSEQDANLSIYNDVAKTLSKQQGISKDDWFKKHIKDIQKGGKGDLFQNDYRGYHQAPLKEGANSLHNLKDIYPDDLYSENGSIYYGHGGDDKLLDKETVKIIKRFKNNPEKKVTIYRAVPKDAESVINDGDWVSINEKYAESHAESHLENDFKIIKKEVPAKHIHTDGNSIHEWGYSEKTDILFQKGKFDPNNSDIRFQQAKGAVKFDKNNSATIIALTNPDASTPVHELAHIFERQLPKGDVSAARRWAKTQGWDGKNKTQFSELFAEGFEKYLAEGFAPTPRMKRVFEQFKQWMKDIYKELQDSPLKLELNDDMRNLYAKILGDKDIKVETKTKESEIEDILFQGKKRKEQAKQVTNSIHNKALKVVGDGKDLDRLKKQYIDNISKENKRRLNEDEYISLREEKGLDHEDVSEFIVRKRGIITEKDALDLANNYHLTIDQIINAKKGTVLNVEQLTAVRQTMEQHRKISEKIKGLINSGGQASTREERAFLKEIGLNESDALYTAYSQNLSKTKQLEYLNNLLREAEIKQRKGDIAVDSFASELGRGLQSIQKVTHGIDSKMKLVLKKLKKVPEEERDAILKIIENEGLDNPKKFLGVLEKINDPNFYEKVVEYGTAILLFNPTTHIINTVGNALRQGVDIALSVGLDPKNAKYEVKGLRAGMSQGYHNMLRSFIDEGYALQQAKWAEMTGKTHAIKGKFGELVRLPFRALGAMDSFFRTIAFNRKLYTEAHEVALKEGLSGKKLDSRISELVAKPSFELAEKANEFAKKMTFQEDMDKVTKFLSNLRDVSGELDDLGDHVKAIIKTLFALNVPFIKTPSNLFKQSFDWSPVGILKNYRSIKEMDVEGRKRLAESIIGTGFLYTAYEIFKAGNLTGGAPIKKHERDKFYREKQPYSIKVDDEWIAYDRLDPFSITVGFLANAMQIKDDETFADMAGKLVRNMGDKTYLQGLKNFYDLAFGDEYKRQRVINNLILRAVPSIVGHTARSIDTTIRDTKGGLLDQFKSIIPFLSKDLPAKRNVFGNTLDRAENGLEYFLSPFRHRTAKIDPITQMLSKHNVSITLPPRSFSLNKEKYKLSPEEYELYSQFIGENIFRDLKNFDDLGKEELEIVIKKLRSAYTNEAKLKIIEGRGNGTTK